MSYAACYYFLNRELNSLPCTLDREGKVAEVLSEKCPNQYRDCSTREACMFLWCHITGRVCDFRDDEANCSILELEQEARNAESAEKP